MTTTAHNPKSNQRPAQKPTCPACGRTFRTETGLAWHTARNNSAGCVEIVAVIREATEDPAAVAEYHAWQHRGVRKPNPSRAGHSDYDNERRAHMRTLRLQGRTS